MCEIREGGQSEDGEIWSSRMTGEETFHLGRRYVLKKRETSVVDNAYVFAVCMCLMIFLHKLTKPRSAVKLFSYLRSLIINRR